MATLSIIPNSDSTTIPTEALQTITSKGVDYIGKPVVSVVAIRDTHEATIHYVDVDGDDHIVTVIAYNHQFHAHFITFNSIGL